jgi:type IV pilus assembly protein PilY1
MNTDLHPLLRLKSSVTQRMAKRLRSAALWVLGSLAFGAAHADLNLPDQPVFTNTGVPGNLALALSVEFPTAVSVAHIDGTYVSATTYLGYFDPNKCYRYNYDAVDPKRNYFYPNGLAAADHKCANNNRWSGNFLNWATMQTIDPFRWALTGGYRSIDEANLTVLEKAWASGQGGTGNFPNKALAGATLVKEATPFAWTNFKMRIQGLGNKMRFTGTGNVDGTVVTVYNPGAAVAPTQGTVYEVYVRVKVCDDSTAAGGVETNCTPYPAGNYKPTGLMQRYSDRIRYSAFGYLNDSNIKRDGGVLRAQQKFIGPEEPVPNGNPMANGLKEWDANNGVMSLNPDTKSASDTSGEFGITIGNSGVMNYLNKFGQIKTGNLKSYDPVGELYYAAVRYYKNLGNVPEWTSMAGLTQPIKETYADGFPVITAWDDPIKYSCQRNFILGIGDVNTHADKNVPGTTTLNNEPDKPGKVSADTTVDAVFATNKVGQLHGLGGSLGSVEGYNGCCNNNSALIAGLAYDSHTKDIRPGNDSKTKGMQTISTYWLDVLEYSTYKNNNQYYLATKYGGFKVPKDFDPYARTTDIPPEWWNASKENVTTGQPRPDNYFVASKPDQMVSGLTRAFASISAELNAYTSSLSTALPQVTASGANSYSAQYDSSTWTGEVTANTVTFNASTGAPSLVEGWRFSDKLAAQIASQSGKGWDKARRIATFNTESKKGVAFRLNAISASQQTALDTAFYSANDSSDYLDYLRGDPSHEESSAATTGAKVYRNRSRALGDIVGSRVRVVGPPAAIYSAAANPGYAKFKTDYKDRTPVVYVGSNDGMLHAINASTKAADTTVAGTEMFAYVPGALYEGPGTAATTGLQTRGDPDFKHRFFVDGNPATFDIDFARTAGGTTSDGWRTILVGGLGKGGKSYYALDVTEPVKATATEADVAAKVLWEFSDEKLGFTYGEPIAVKTRKYGWVLVFGSGYNNSDGVGYIFIVNPRTGALIKRVTTKKGSTSDEAGLAHVQAYVLDRTDNTADALYAGDLLGNLWRVDVSSATDDPADDAMHLAELRNKDDQLVPVTSRPLVVIQPYTNVRWVVVGTGRLLNSDDISSGQSQAFFAIQDGKALGPNLTAPSGMSFPLKRGNLHELKDLTKTVVIDKATEAGWWFDLGASAGKGWRVLSDPASFYGEVAFTTMLPSVDDPCSPGGISRIYSINLGTGQSQLVNDAGTTIAYNDSAISGVATDQRFFSVDGKPRLIVCDDKGTCSSPQRKEAAPLAARRINWRELQLAD